MRCIMEMGVYLSRTGSTLNVKSVLGALGLNVMEVLSILRGNVIRLLSEGRRKPQS